MSGAIPSWCRVGAKVTCIKQGVWNVDGKVYDLGERKPTYGEVLTIRAIVDLDDDGCGLLFYEIRNRANRVNGRGEVVEVCFDVSRFRPLHTLETDIAAYFVKLLDVDVPANHERERA